VTIRAVLWDIADRAALARHLAAEGRTVAGESPEEALRRWREITDERWARFEAGETDFHGRRRERVRAFLGLTLADDEADAWFARCLVHHEQAWALFPDSRAALDALAGDYRQAVLSNSSLHVQDHKLRTLGVRDHFEQDFCAVELGSAKPAAAAFLTCCDALGLEPCEAVYVGNEPEIDAAGAAAAGLAAVWLDRLGRGGRPELVSISGLGLLPALLRDGTRFGAVSRIG
jgi:putative hydrolase of the HAD superfamily